jgi:hypothetical protein
MRSHRVHEGTLAVGGCRGCALEGAAGRAQGLESRCDMPLSRAKRQRDYPTAARCRRTCLAFAISPVSEQSRARHGRPTRRVAGRKAVFRVHVNGIDRRVFVRFTIAQPPFCILWGIPVDLRFRRHAKRSTFWSPRLPIASTVRPITGTPDTDLILVEIGGQQRQATEQQRRDQYTAP